jgi:hypothetical protein
MFEGIETSQFDAVSGAMEESCHVVRSNVAPVIEGPRNAVDDLKYVQTFQNFGKLHNAQESLVQQLEWWWLRRQQVDYHDQLDIHRGMNNRKEMTNGNESRINLS